jgi:GAF domain-containing protein
MQSTNLQVQLEKLNLDKASAPSLAQWQKFLQMVGSAYNEYEQTLSAHRLNNELLVKASSILDPIETVEIMCEELARTFGVPQAAVALLNPERTEAHVVAEYLAKGRPSGLGLVFPIIKGQATEIVVRSQKPVVIHNVQTDPLMAAYHEALVFRGTVTMLIAPILVGGQVIGTFGLDSLEERKYSPNEISMVQRAMAATGQV